MDQTGDRSYRQTQNKDTASAERFFADGMHAFALSRPQQLRTLCRLSAAAVLGILLGIVCFWFFGIQPIADTQTAAREYIGTRAFSSYDSMRAYTAFFGAWFSHHALPMLLPLITVITVYPLPLCYSITALRGVLCGFSICMLTGTFSVFTVYMTFAQSALCALCIYICTKCIRYAGHRSRRSRQQKSTFSLQWLLGDAAPLTVALLLALTALALGQLLISCGCTLLAG